jgi:hypothetical protein
MRARQLITRLWPAAAALLTMSLVFGALAGASSAQETDATDPVRNLALPCEVVQPAVPMPARTARGITHVANVCEIVGTDIEFASRTAANGTVHDYTFVGTMGAGFQIFDVTVPTDPAEAGGYIDSGWQNDVQVRGDIVVATFDGVAGEDSSLSTCLKTRYPNGRGQGVDIYRLAFDPATAKFDVSLLTCVANPPGGAHNATLHPSGNWLAISNCCSDWSVDVVDLRPVVAGTGDAVHRYRLIDASRQASAGRCPAGATFTCIVMTAADGSSASGLWDPHDIHFSANGRTMYVAAIESTFVVDVRRVLDGQVQTLSIIPNLSEEGGLANARNIDISHQADVTPDGKILVISDERGGGLSNTSCNTDANGVIGGLHFWALGSIKGIPATRGASPASPIKIGSYFNPNPNLGLDPLEPAVDLLPRTERACTVHVFRIGGNGSSSPGAAAPGTDGVSRLGNRQLVTAWYGAGTWYVDFSSAPSSDDGVAEDPRSTWGNTLGWSVMPGAETWSAKEYKGFIYTGDMLRGFDVFRFTPGSCEALGC